MNELIQNLNEMTLAAFCERWGVVELALFGSALRDGIGARKRCRSTHQLQ